MNRRSTVLITVMATAVTGLVGAPASTAAAPAAPEAGTPRGDTVDNGWVQQSALDSPSARGLHQLAYDAELGETIMFGGYGVTGGGGGFAHGTWAWDGTTWRKVPTKHAPPRRTSAVMAYDPVREEIVLFGGDRYGAKVDDKLHARNDTWVFADGDWTRRAPETSPPPTTHATMGFDPHLQQIIVFGGEHPDPDDYYGIVENETWAWDGTTWRLLTPRTKPPLRAEADLAFDPTRGRLVVFGGRQYGSTYLNDTWSWDGQTWKREAEGDAPPARSRLNLATFGEHVVMFGGEGFNRFFDDTWILTGDGWDQLAPRHSPSLRWAPDLTWDPVRNEAVLFGGVVVEEGQPAEVSDETWTLSPQA